MDSPSKAYSMNKIEHIAFAVKSLETSIPLFEKLTGTTCYKTELVASEQVRTAFFMLGETKMELLESTSPDGVIARFIEKRGEGMHHIAFAVENIQAEMERLKNEGFSMIREEPKDGADHKRICFLQPRDTNGVLVELCQEKNDNK